jgi:hypothetical protein
LRHVSRAAKPGVSVNCARVSKLLKTAVAVISVAWCGSTLADDKEKKEPGEEAQSFVHGAPGDPSEAWTLAAGGRIYDNWWEALERSPSQPIPPTLQRVNRKDRELGGAKSVTAGTTRAVMASTAPALTTQG